MPNSCSAASRCPSPPTAACRSNTPRASTFCAKHPSSFPRYAPSASKGSSVRPIDISRFSLTVATPTWNRSTATSTICGKSCAAKTGFCCGVIRRSLPPSTIRCRPPAPCSCVTSKRPGRQLEARRIDGSHILHLDFRQPREHRIAAGDPACGERRTQHSRCQRRERRLCYRREAQMPGLRLHTALISRIGPEKSIRGHVCSEPCVEPCEGAIPAKLRAHQLRTVVWGNGGAIDDVYIRAPMMTARAGKRGPDETGVDESALAQVRMY